MKLKYFLVTSLCIALGLVGSAQTTQPAFVTDSLDAFVKREMQRWQIPGLAIAIVKDGAIVLTKGYGETAVGSGKAVNENTLFQIASNSKAFTGTAMALLNHRKQALLDQPVTTYLPYFKLYEPTSTQLTTVRDLLCHRIGMQTFQGDFLNWGSNLSRKEIVERMALTKPTHPFRYKYGYCNAAYVAAGEVILAATDTTWDNYLQAHFFNPLGLQRTFTNYQTMLNDANACKPHTLLRNGKLTTLPLANIDNMGASASISSCVADMSKWVLMQLNNGVYNGKTVIPIEVIAETRKSHMVNTDVNSPIFKSKHFVNYGLGWQMYDYEGKRVIEHSGGSNGFVTKTEFIPEMQLGVIVYTNSDANSLYDALCKQIVESYLNMPYRNLSEIYFQNYTRNKAKQAEALKQLTQENKQPLTLPLKAFEGEYQNDFYGKVWIKLIKNKLQLHFQHHPQNIGMLEYIGNNKFLCTYTDVTYGVEVMQFSLQNNAVGSITVKIDDFIDYLSYEFKAVNSPNQKKP